MVVEKYIETMPRKLLVLVTCGLMSLVGLLGTLTVHGIIKDVTGIGAQAAEADKIAQEAKASSDANAAAIAALQKDNEKFHTEYREDQKGLKADLDTLQSDIKSLLRKSS